VYPGHIPPTLTLPLPLPLPLPLTPTLTITLTLTKAFIAIAADGHALLDPSLDIFGPIAERQPLFAAWRASNAQETVSAADGTTKHCRWKVLAEAQRPQNAANQRATEMTVELAEVMAKAALLKLHDPKLALADKLSSQDGCNSLGKNAEAHEATKGAHVSNCTVESNFGCYDYVLRCFRSISVDAAAAVAQQMRMHHFDTASAVQRSGRGSPEERELGFFHALPEAMKQSLVEWARQAREESRKVERADKVEQAEYHRVRREQNLEEQLDKLVNVYTTAVKRFHAYERSGVRDKQAVAARLAEMVHSDGAPKVAPQKAYLKEQIEMRVLGLGWTQFATVWSSGKDAHIGTIVHLQKLLEEILVYEMAQRRLQRIPTEAAAPEMKARTMKELGTATCDAQELAAQSLFSVEEVRLAAVAEQLRRDEALEDDPVEREQPSVAPPLDASLVGMRLEVCWKYFSTETGEPLLIWSPGEVLRVADGTSDKASERCRTMLPAGMVLLKWAEDADRKEKETQSWKVLLPQKFNKQVQYAWRYDPRDVPRVAPGPEVQARCRAA